MRLRGAARSSERAESFDTSRAMTTGASLATSCTIAPHDPHT
jgi:hypothetical protein